MNSMYFTKIFLFLFVLLATDKIYISVSLDAIKYFFLWGIQIEDYDSVHWL